MITISFYSYKGGVGRSLALTNLGVYLAQFGATVVMIDFDLEAPGLHYKVCPGAPLAVGSDGIARLLASAGSNPTEDLNYDIALDVSDHVEPPTVVEEHLDQPRGRLLLVPAGNPQDPEYWRNLSQLDWPRLFTGKDRPGVRVLAALKEHLVKTYDPDILLIDSRTGITPAGGVATTLLPDVVVTLLLNTDEHRDGTRLVVSTIANASAGASPRIVPVLSRYTGHELLEQVSDFGPRRRRIAPRALADADLSADEIPLVELREALTRDLDENSAAKVADPLVLHADLALQRNERLTFGPYASAASDQGEALLDDYLRLFASLVPREVVSRHLAGVRSRVRGILLDRPDDAVRTLENLAGLVGDEEVFADLVKVYVLRRDVRSMLAAADRLHHVHGSIVIQPEITQAMREILIGRPQRFDPSPLRADFLEEYWRRAGSDDVEWGAALASALVARGSLKRGMELAEELIARSGEPGVLAELVGSLARGDREAERLAATLALRHFQLGALSDEFLRAASLACRYQPDSELAECIIGADAFPRLDRELAIDVLLAAGREDQAGPLLVDVLSSAELGEAIVEHAQPRWTALLHRNRELRAELQDRNPAVADYLDAVRDEPWRSPRGRPR